MNRHDTPAQAVASYKLDLPATRRRHSDDVKYIVAVMWTAGYSAGTIGRMLGMSSKRALNLAQKQNLIDRATASDEDRQKLLNDLQAIRCEDGAPLDGGRLDKFDWKVIALEGRKVRKGEGGRQ
ncbi:hypothetical protein [Rhizobium alvei]|uniref:Uncharacterized protein n=1 Tax=Rhizobium alvei TaxID=1132659 RepID=A0ABT8YKF7_9HYPH|nr:hypothetical protein [Rhizobium alvei]MDO6963982.1 hypothetical protein [Rhizobium alvei]